MISTGCDSTYGKGCRCDACKEVKRAKDRAYYAANRDAMKAKMAEYQRTHRAQRNAYLAEWREANREHLRDYHRQWSTANRDLVRASGARTRAKSGYSERRLAYRTANREAERERLRRWRAANPERLATHRATYRLRHADSLREKSRLYYAQHRSELRARAKAKWPQVREWHAEWRSGPGAASRRASHLRRRARLRDRDHGCVTTDALRQIWAAADGACAYCGDPGEHIDHVIPLNGFGAHCVTNLAVACAACNLEKSDSIIPEAERPTILVACAIL